MENLDPDGRETVAKFLRPMIVTALAFLVISLQMATMIMYFLGNIVFGDVFAGSPGWAFAGGWFML